MNDIFTPHHAFDMDAEEPRMAAAYLWSRTSALRELMELFQEVRTRPGVRMTARRDGALLSVESRVFAYVDWDGRIDVPLSSESLNPSRAEGAAGSRADHKFAWGLVPLICTTAETRRALRLLRAAYLRHKPRTTAA